MKYSVRHIFASAKSSIVSLALLLVMGAGVSSCVVESGDYGRNRGNIQSAALGMFNRYLQNPLEYMRVGLVLDEYLSLSEEEKASEKYDFLRESYSENNGVHTVFGYSYTMKGGSIWDKDAVWGSDLAMTIRRADADSTWNLSVVGDRLSDCSVQVRLTSPVDVSSISMVATVAGDYTSGEHSAHFSAKDFKYSWERKVSYNYVDITPSYHGTFEVLFYDGPMQMDWARIIYNGTDFVDISTSRDNY